MGVGAGIQGVQPAGMWLQQAGRYHCPLVDCCAGPSPLPVKGWISHRQPHPDVGWCRVQLRGDIDPGTDGALPQEHMEAFQCVWAVTQGLCFTCKSLPSPPSLLSLCLSSFCVSALPQCAVGSSKEEVPWRGDCSALGLCHAVPHARLCHAGMRVLWAQLLA